VINALDNAGIFLTKILFGMFVVLLILRLLLSWHRANYHNPVCQLIGKLTNPVIKPLAQWIPNFKRIDTAALVLALVLNLVQWTILVYLQTGHLFPMVIVPIALIDFLTQFCQVLIYSLIFMIIISWLNPGVYNPVSEVLYMITEPILRPIRRLIPPVAGFDISPIPAMIGIGVIIVILKSLI